MGGSRHHPERAARRVSLQQRYEDDAARQQREKKLERGEDELVPVDLRDDPSVPDEFVKELSCYGGGVKSLTQITHLARFANLRSLCVNGCALTRMDVDPLMRPCATHLVELNLSSNAIAAVEGLCALPALKRLDLTNNRIASLSGVDDGAPLLETLMMRDNRVRSLHALTTPRRDGKRWALKHLDVRRNRIGSFADVAAGLRAVASLRSIRFKSTPDSDSTASSLDAMSVARSGNDNAVCAMANYRDAIAAIAPWIEELDSVPIAADAVALERGESAVGKDLNEKRAVKETEAEVRSAGGGGGGAKPAASKSPKRTPKIDEALQRYRARSGRSIDLPPRRDLEYEKAPAREEPEPSRRSQRREPEPEPEPSNSDASGESYELTPTRAVSRRERAFTSPARSRKSVQVAVDDPAVVDHEMRLQRIERNILPVVSEARRRAAATVAEAEDAARRREAGTQATSSAADADAADADAANRASRKRKEEDEDSSRVARVSGELAALKKRVEEVAAAAAPETREEPAAAASAAAATGKREKRAASKVVPPPEPPKTRRGRSEAKAAAAAAATAAAPGALTPAPATRGGGPQKKPSAASSTSWADMTEVEDASGAAVASSSALDPTAPSFTAPAVVSKEKKDKKEKTKPGAIETTVASYVATAGALPPTPSPKDREMQRVKAELEEAKAEIEMHVEAIRWLTEQNAETASRRDAADAAAAATAAAAAAAEATLAEVREEASANLGAMRAMHVSELESKTAALEAATRAKDEATRLAEASRAKLAAVEDEFRAALGEFETERAVGAREVEELRAVARAAVSGRKDAEALAEELADVCEQQRRALEELSREKRLRARAEDDLAAARNDLGEMQTRTRKAEKRATLAEAGEKAAKEELARIRETELRATAGLKEVDAMRAQMELAKDNVRIKDAMLESQCELIASLKHEAARSKDAKDGAVKKAADAERKSDEKARRLEEELRLMRADLAAADAAVDKLERDAEDARVARVAAEDKAEAMTREIEERDQMLSYVSGEVENVKSLFSERERNLRAERDELAAAVADRDAIEADARAEARRAREDAVAVRAECESSIVAAREREAAAAKREHAAGERVRRIEGEMRALLAEVASQKRHSRDRAKELGTMLKDLYA